MRRRRKFLNSMVLVVILPSKNTILYAPQAKIFEQYGACGDFTF